MFNLKNALTVVAALALQLALNSFVFGQAAPRELPVEKVASSETSRAQGMLKGKDALDAAVLQRYIKNEMARLTIVKDVAGFTSVRANLLQLIRSGSSDAAKKLAADTVITYAKGIAGSAAFHPASRVNAMVALTELELESNAPYAGTFVVLEASAKDANLPLHLRSIALYGLNRHARASALPQARKDSLATDLTAIVSSHAVSPLDAKAHAWMIRRAFDVLTSLAASQAVDPAIARLLDDKELVSLRLAATDYLARVDLSKLTDEKKTQYFIGLAQMLEQQLVRWYDREEDFIKMKSGAVGGDMGSGMGMGMGMGGMGGMGMGGGGSEGYGGEGKGGMGMGMGGGGSEGYGGEGMGGMGMGGMGGAGAGPKPKALDTQPWEVRLSRRFVNQVLQTAHVALDGKQVKNGKSVSAAGKGLVDLGLPADISEPASNLLKAVESLQTRVNDAAKITTMNSLLNQTKKPIENIMDLVRDIPALTAQYPKYQEKDELNDVSAQTPANPPAGAEGDAAAPAEGAAEGSPEGAAAPGDAGAPPAGVPAAGNPAVGNPPDGNNAAQPPAGAK